MKEIIFLVSSYGGVLRFTDKCIKHGILKNYKISKVISDRQCGAIDFAKQQNIPHKIIPYNSKDRVSLLKEMSSDNFDIAITNIHKILDPTIVNDFRGKLINVHPSLLPAFKGLNAVDDAIISGVKFVGTTVHEVDEEMDNGKILAQTVTPIDLYDNRDALIQEIFQSWCISLTNILSLYDGKQLAKACSCYNNTIYSPGICFDTNLISSEIWQEIKEGI